MIAASPLDTAALLGIDLNPIGWCDLTLNPGLAGCGKVSPACVDCYAEVTAAGIVRKGRSDKAPPGMRAVADFYAKGLTDDGRWTGRVHVDPSRLKAAFAKLPKKPGSKVRRVFVTSMSDLFHKDVPFEFIRVVFREMRARPWFIFQVVTKRAARAAEFARWLAALGEDWPAHVWFIVTVEDQRRAEERIPYALQVPAAVRGLSVEPMLDDITLDYIGMDYDGMPGCVSPLTGSWWPALGNPSAEAAGRREIGRLHWIIIGSESDGPRPGARETEPEWVLDLVDQCDAAGVPVFVKQLEVDGRLCALPAVNGRVRAEFPEVKP